MRKEAVKDRRETGNPRKRYIMKTVAYLRVSRDSQGVKNQRPAILEFARREKMEVDDFVESTVSSRKSTKERKVDQLLKQLDTEDTLIVCELSRMGRQLSPLLGAHIPLASPSTKVAIDTRSRPVRRRSSTRRCRGTTWHAIGM